MILVDTSVWVDFFKGTDSLYVRLLLDTQTTLENEVCISGVIYFELLRGITERKHQKQVRQWLTLLQRRDMRHDSYEKMLENDIVCKSHGITLSGVADWQIVQTALDHDLELLTSDRGFYRIAPLVNLKLVRVDS